jgi:hypothetical protein
MTVKEIPMSSGLQAIRKSGGLRRGRRPAARGPGDGRVRVSIKASSRNRRYLARAPEARLPVAAGISGCATDGRLRHDAATNLGRRRCHAKRNPMAATREQPPAKRPPASAPVPPPQPAGLPDELEGRALVSRLLPATRSRSRRLGGGYLCRFRRAATSTDSRKSLRSAMSVIAQESSFQADPSVPGLSRIVWQELDRRPQEVRHSAG